MVYPEDEKNLNEYIKLSSTVPDSLKADFIAEAEEHLMQIEENLLVLEKNPMDPNPIHAIFRSIHSIKGASNYVNLKLIANIADNFETLFDQIRKGIQQFNSSHADAVLITVDVLKALVKILIKGKMESEIRISATINLMSKLLVHQPEKAESATSTKNDLSDPKRLNNFHSECSKHSLIIRFLGKEFVAQTLNQKKQIVLRQSITAIKVCAQQAGFSKMMQKVSRLEALFNQLTSDNQQKENNYPEFGKINKELQIEISQKNAEIRELLQHPKNAKSVKYPEIEKLTTISGTTTVSDSGSTENQLESSTNQITKDSQNTSTRVSSHQLDTFVDLNNNLLDLKLKYQTILSNLARQGLNSQNFAELKKVESSLGFISSNIQQTVSDLRLIPIKSLFQKLPRIIRDISRKTGKKIQLRTTGDNIDLDKSIVETLADPLIHLVRNSCDHGIEKPAERYQRGKPLTGQILIEALYENSTIFITLSDDGIGINHEKIKQVALRKGMITLEHSYSIDNDSLMQFLFHPGFTTVEKITEISGRGVGMDVVMTDIKKVNGTVKIKSEPGKGTQVILCIPNIKNQ